MCAWSWSSCCSAPVALVWFGYRLACDCWISENVELAGQPSFCVRTGRGRDMWMWRRLSGTTTGPELCSQGAPDIPIIADGDTGCAAHLPALSSRLIAMAAWAHPYPLHAPSAFPDQFGRAAATASPPVKPTR